MNLALKMFIEEKGKELLEKNLYRNFVVHVCNLFEFGVLGNIDYGAFKLCIFIYVKVVESELSKNFIK